MNTPNQSQLGKATAYADHYDPQLLFPIARAQQRQQLGLGEALPFLGADLWTAYELSWLNPKGKPVVAMARFTVPCESTHLIESKSLKLYLNSFNNSVFPDAQAVREHLRQDLGAAIWQGGPVRAGVGVQLIEADQFDAEPIHEMDGVNLDRLDLECTDYQPNPEWLVANTDEQPVSETLVSRLLKSNCLVTGQPDWGSVQIRYSGPQIDQAGLLRYIVSFRNHNEFHEHCVERIFTDIWAKCQPTQLQVYARYTRRGGLDINPWRSSYPDALPRSVRTARQ